MGMDLGLGPHNALDTLELGGRLHLDDRLLVDPTAPWGGGGLSPCAHPSTSRLKRQKYAVSRWGRGADTFGEYEQGNSRLHPPWFKNCGHPGGRGQPNWAKRTRWTNSSETSQSVFFPTQRSHAVNGRKMSQIRVQVMEQRICDNCAQNMTLLDSIRSVIYFFYVNFFRRSVPR